MSDPSSDLGSSISLRQTQTWLRGLLTGFQSTPVHSVAIEIRGCLVVGKVQQATEYLFRRHDVLRVAFEESAQEVMVYGDSSLETPFELVLVEHLAEEASESSASLVDVLSEARLVIGSPFDRLVRVQLAQISVDHFVLVVEVHSLLADEESAELLMRELMDCYFSLLNGEPLVPATAAQFSEFVLWEADLASAEVARQEMDYWAGKLDNAPMLTDIPASLPLTATRSGRTERLSAELAAYDIEALRALSSRYRLPVSSMITAAYAAVMAVYSGQSEVVIACSAGRREGTPFAGTVGPINDLVPLRLKVEDLSFIELLDAVVATTVEASENIVMPFQQTAASTQVAGGGLCNIALLFSDIKHCDVVEGLDLKRLYLSQSESTFDLKLQIDRSLRVMTLEYSTDLFIEEDALRLVSHLEAVLHAIAERPKSKIADVNLLSESELALLESWSTSPEAPNQTSGPDTLHGMFEEQVAKTPNLIAVLDGEVELSYSELDRRACSFASSLVASQCGLGDVVAVFERRSWKLAVACLGIMKAGAVYLPISADSPPQRITTMLVDSDATAVVGLESGAGWLPEGITEFSVGEAIASSSQPMRAKTLPLVASSDAAYMIFTSGSSGTPKAVIVEHGNIVPLIEWNRSEMCLMPGAIATQTFEPSFDPSIMETFMALTQGATVTCISRRTLLDADDTVDALSSLGAYSLMTTPAQLELLLSAERSLEFLQLVAVGGEALSAELAGRILDAVSDTCTVWNVYGPTECAVMQTASKIDRTTLERDRPFGIVSIGQPVAGAECRVVDDEGRIVPIGAIGELVIGGSCVSRGYHNRPAQTEASFRPDRYAPGKRVYHTGDMVRYAAGGSLRFLGRRDDQIKLRGLRIELGEIQAALTRVSGVRAAYVLVDRSQSQGGRLCAYVASDDNITATQLRSALKDRLPRYMIPSHYWVLDTLPVTRRGKIDRRALIDLEPQTQTQNTADVEPSSDTEVKIASAWKDTIGVECTDVYRDFFDSGGSSLDAVSLAMALSELSGFEVRPNFVYKNPTIVNQAIEIELLVWHAGKIAQPSPGAPRETGQI